MAALPSPESFRQSAFDETIWYARIDTSMDEEKTKDNKSLRINIKKTSDSHDEDEKTFENDHFSINIVKDTSFLPENTDFSVIPEFEPAAIGIDLQYSSKYAQNSATIMNITAELKQGDSSLRAEGQIKTAPPWLFMPFEVIDPIETGTKKEDVIMPYLTDWISNASSMIRHISSETESVSVIEVQSSPDTAEDSPEETKDEPAETDTEAETQPMDEPEEP